ncbi:hypothetical protein ERW51_10820 [Aliivibrio finisterrensis]|uniref:VanZ family protein n=1 Tax=Aliivibrio finisterrensis TaxID=511998 RepID=UPI0010214EAF|nr:VanZ family protein [Aliivibrio finisterrensis]RYU67909.1 hypothetical protein ERW54_11015 [Aliivibrio finisterrensis]RYU71566.1 hypothetical protein ERW51_10820 [Aliivibrio finisterrensis]RYU74728.1 hypothetical protein ERW48_10405 [Aliivibrio finisterrensis]
MGKIAKMPFTILIASVLLFGSASIFKSSGILGNEIRTVEIAIHGAIYLHLFASLLLGIFCRLATKQNLCLALPPTTVFVLLLVILDESIQFFIPSRQFSWLDMQVNVFGVLLGTYFTHAVLWHKSKRKALP